MDDVTIIFLGLFACIAITNVAESIWGRKKNDEDEEDFE